MIYKSTKHATHNTEYLTRFLSCLP